MGRDRSGHCTKKMQDFKKNSLLICHYCKKHLTYSESTVDHKTPISRGGLDEEENYAIACWPCNSDKNDMTEEEYIQFRREYGSRQRYLQEKALERARKRDSAYIDVKKFFREDKRR